MIAPIGIKDEKCIKGPSKLPNMIVKADKAIILREISLVGFGAGID
jgi:hypothetical protein